jgi:hypothetical protein
MGYLQDSVRIFGFITCHFSINPTLNILARLPQNAVRQQYEARRTGWPMRRKFLKIIYQISTGKSILFTDMKESGRIAPHILKLATTWMRVSRFTPKRLYAPVTHLIRAERAPQPAWTLRSRLKSVSHAQNRITIPRFSIP